MKEKKVAILDLGTNTFHLMIAEIGLSSFRIIHKVKYPVKIGQNGINNGKIREAGIHRALKAISLIEKILGNHKVDDIKAVATSGIRSASNGEDLLNKINELLGIKAEIIEGNQEAEYIYLGVRQALNIGPGTSLIMDIGGGSVEFIMANQYEIFWKKSIEIGAQRLYDKFHIHDPVSKKDLVALEEYLQGKLHPLQQALKRHRPDTLIGSSGTFDTLSDIFCEKHHLIKHGENTENPISLREFHSIHEEIISKNRKERLKIPGMAAMRADMIGMSTLLIKFVLKSHRFINMRASAYSLKEGMLACYIEDDQIRELSA